MGTGKSEASAFDVADFVRASLGSSNPARNCEYMIRGLQEEDYGYNTKAALDFYLEGRPGVERIGPERLLNLLQGYQKEEEHRARTGEVAYSISPAGAEERSGIIACSVD